ncbi:hypothetical protein DM02DRAFT_654786 [Periconia macrospinosa]|uniref:Uncharacterized protein n=1 Tax=Periconia macrospinosa TaxID=97972 RepID=A0A2V1DV52_9PLEO|nr:hypothetical protein DM02DRAFT_654786 [Periconia macrospinosa]
MAKLIDTSSSQSFPLASRVLRPRRTPSSSSSSSSPSRSKKPHFLPDFPDSAAIYQMILAVLCFVAALYTNITVLAAGLRLVAPELPGACLWVYGGGYGLVLYIGRCERLVEARWRAERREGKEGTI